MEFCCAALSSAVARCGGPLVYSRSKRMPTTAPLVSASVPIVPTAAAMTLMVCPSPTTAPTELLLSFTLTVAASAMEALISVSVEAASTSNQPVAKPKVGVRNLSPLKLLCLFLRLLVEVPATAFRKRAKTFPAELVPAAADTAAACHLVVGEREGGSSGKVMGQVIGGGG